MEQLTYRFSLDTHKNGIQRVLQGFETGDSKARAVEITLVENSETYELTNNITAMLYIEGIDIPRACDIEDNKISYVFQNEDITSEGNYECQVKIIETSVHGAERVIMAPRFSIEAWESNADDTPAEESDAFTALENAISKAIAAYNARITSFEFSDDFSLTVIYGLAEDGMQIVYTTDIFKNAVSQMQPTIEVGNVTEGDEVSVVNSGTATNVVLDFTLAKGTPGPAGETGPAGPPGAEGVSVQHGEFFEEGIKLIIDLDENYPASGGGEGGGLTPADVEKITADYIEAHKDELKGDRGPKGEQGNDGSDYVITTADYDAIADVVIRRLPQAESEAY